MIKPFFPFPFKITSKLKEPTNSRCFFQRQHLIIKFHALSLASHFNSTTSAALSRSPGAHTPEHLFQPLYLCLSFNPLPPTHTHTHIIVQPFFSQISISHPSHPRKQRKERKKKNSPSSTSSLTFMISFSAFSQRSSLTSSSSRSRHSFSPPPSCSGRRESERERTQPSRISLSLSLAAGREAHCTLYRDPDRASRYMYISFASSYRALVYSCTYIISVYMYVYVCVYSTTGAVYISIIQRERDVGTQKRARAAASGGSVGLAKALSLSLPAAAAGSFGACADRRRCRRRSLPSALSLSALSCVRVCAIGPLALFFVFFFLSLYSAGACFLARARRGDDDGYPNLYPHTYGGKV